MAISHELNLSSSTAYRLLSSLSSHRLIQLEESTGNYRLGIACLELSYAYHSKNEVRRVAMPELEKLRDTTKETVHLAVLDEIEIIYLEKLEGLFAIGIMSSRVGKRAPAYCTGIGKALIAYEDSELIRIHFREGNLKIFTENTIADLDRLLEHLQKVRQRGYAVDVGEHESEVRCIAAPIFDQNGKAIAAISVSGPKKRMDPVERNEKLIEKTMETANTISAKLGYNADQR
jgi:DNA-binding IclR family transcriptional regulator